MIVVYMIVYVYFFAFNNTWSSANVTKAKARNGLGMKTSVTSPYCMKNWRRSSVVISSVQRPTNTFRLLRGSSGPCCKQPRGKRNHYSAFITVFFWPFHAAMWMDITRFTFELGSLQSHHLPSIIWRWEITFSWASYSVNLTNPNPLELPVLASRLTWENKQTIINL